jgi:predicted enzyme related to lactoylglutathione lyase
VLGEATLDEGADMHERNGYPAGVPCWIDTAQPDPDAAAAFYGGLFGWKFEDVMPADSPGRYLVGRLAGRDVGAVASQAEGVPSVPAWNTYVRVDSADEATAKVRDGGGAALVEPMDMRDAGRMATFADPSGAAFSVWQPKEFAGAQLVNEPGTWNFSELNTRDPEGAAAFYGSVLGWGLSTFNGGGAEFTTWRVPGYGDHLAASDPELRERLANDGAPDGFEDAVAVLIEMTGDRSPDEAPPHWSITFAVDDADATTARAFELGGEVIVPPFDAPYVRMAVLSDPQGAVFNVSKYVPMR